MFQQILSPAGNLALTWLVALVPVVMLLVLLAVFRVSAWIATLIGSIVTFLLGVWVWRMPFGDGARAYLYGSATGIWAVDWITIWGVILFNTLVVTGVFEKLPLAKSLRGQPTYGFRQCFLLGPSERFSKAWSASVTLGHSSPQS
jgi:lactate permease